MFEKEMTLLYFHPTDNHHVRMCFIQSRREKGFKRMSCVSNKKTNARNMTHQPVTQHLIKHEVQLLLYIPFMKDAVISKYTLHTKYIVIPTAPRTNARRP